MGLFVADLRLLDITENRRIRATSSIGLIYEFDFDLKLLQLSWGHAYIIHHQNMTEAGKLTSVLDDAYRDALLKGIRYWNGSEWTAEPAKNRT